jgi:hypothetical protein
MNLVQILLPDVFIEQTEGIREGWRDGKLEGWKDGGLEGWRIGGL